jgi:hypothetical protein
VLGTDEDIQKRSDQVKKLQDENVLVFPSNADAALFVKKVLAELMK